MDHHVQRTRNLKEVANFIRTDLQNPITMKKILTLLWLTAATAAAAQPIADSLLHGLQFRSIGPARMSGRVTSIDVVQKDKSIIYVGTSAGSLWKSVNAGTTYEPLFENERTASVGDLAIYQKNPNILYLGTGEGNPRNSQSLGYGMYKSTDAGKSWKHIGLELTRTIDKVIVHPDNPDIVWAGAQGSAWGLSEHRGVYKTTDGGQNWEKVLYVNSSTGVADMVMDPENPNRIFAAMWDFQRWPWFMRSGGPGSGLYVSNDGGGTWDQLGESNGLPGDTLGKIGLAIAPGDPQVVYALVETREENALYRSSDGGAHFEKTTSEGVGDRPFYYMDLAVDPLNENRVYHIAGAISVSEDGGKSFSVLLDMFSGVHVDHHAFWIDPDNPDHMLDGNDGGLYTSHDRGRNWRFQQNLPVAQYYHINVDMEVPYYVYGGMQDNGSWCGPAYRFVMMEGIRNWEFENIGFGDGFDVIPDPDDPMVGYSMSQGGSFQRYDRRTGITSGIQPKHPEGMKLRFNWDAGFAIDPIDRHTIYGGSQFVHRSRDKGRSWEIISPDLTTNDPEKQKQHKTGGLTIDNTTAENHCSILVIEPSSIEEGLIWVGTDDGNIQLTRDGGTTWTDVTGNLGGVPANSWVCQIKHSVHNQGEAFVVIEDHRRDNWTPYLFHTEDYGKTWERLVDENDVWGFALSFVQDPVEPDLMFLGTEFGLWFTLNGGENWQHWKDDFPTVSVKDLVIHPREHDLVAGTFGRSVYILDDIRPLRELAGRPGLRSSGLHLFSPPPAYLGAIAFHDFFAGAQEGFSGENRPEGALLSYYLGPDAPADSVLLEVSSPEGDVIRSIQSKARPGINRLAWDLKTEGSVVPGKMSMYDNMMMGGAPVYYGDYTVTLKVGELADSKTLTVLKDPNTPITDEELKENIRRKKAFNQTADVLVGEYKKVEEAIASMQQVRPLLAGDDQLIADLDSLQSRAGQLKRDMVPVKTKGILGDTPDLKSQVLSLAGYYSNPMVMPVQSSEIAFEQLKEKIADLQIRVSEFVEAYQVLRARVNENGALQWN